MRFHHLLRDFVNAWRVLAAALLAAVWLWGPFSAAQAAPEEPAASLAAQTNIDLLRVYPTSLTSGDADPSHARAWEFSETDLFKLSQFHLKAGPDLTIDIGPADLGIGHCADGAVWAIVIPEERGTLARRSPAPLESIRHLWLRFHPAEINRLFPPQAVFARGTGPLVSEMRYIAGQKISSSWQAGMKAMIPDLKNITADIDTKDDLRRFFIVDTTAQTAQYISAFEHRAVKSAPALTPGLAESAFDQLWAAFDQKYPMFVLRPEVNWGELKDRFRPRAIASKSTLELAETCAEMLKPLRDLHVWLTLQGAYIPVFSRPRVANSNPTAFRNLLADLHTQGPGIQWAVTKDSIGFIAIHEWSGPELAERCHEVLEQMRDTRGLIIDVRLNGGGSEPLAEEFAGRFLDSPHLYAKSRFRNGPSHTSLTEMMERIAQPVGPWRYNRPVIVLIGQKCMSSNESFIAMMEGGSNVMTMGDHTCGSSGNPNPLSLPLGITVGVPQWIDYLADGTPLDERGILPKIVFQPAPGAFEGERDDLLLAALDRLRKEPLPAKPIEGPRYLSDKQFETEDESRPKVVAVSPANGADNIKPNTEIKIRFDRPMDPFCLKLNWVSGGSLKAESPSYNPEKYEFALSTVLTAGAQQIGVNYIPSAGSIKETRLAHPRDGFQTPDHRLARQFTWQFRVQVPEGQPAGRQPQAIQISPPPGSTMPLLGKVEIEFDRPMAAPGDGFPFIPGKPWPMQPGMIPKIELTASGHGYRIPLLFPSQGGKPFNLAGFRSDAGIAADPVPLNYRASTNKLSESDQERFKKAAADQRLLDLLAQMKQQRAQLHTIDEQVQVLYFILEKGLITTLKSQTASFQWQAPNQYFADVSSIMNIAAFRIGCDGQNWWWHSASRKRTNVITCPFEEMHRLNLSLDDPFGLALRTPAEAAGNMHLTYTGVANPAEGRRFYTIEGWNIAPIDPTMTSGEWTEWQIDALTLSPTEINQFGNSVITRTRILRAAQGKPPATELFAIPEVTGATPKRAEALDAGYTNRFVNLRDGSDGRMSVRWGKEGSEGTSSSGLN